MVFDWSIVSYLKETQTGLCLVRKIKQMKVAQLLCLLWILYLNTDVLAQRQRGVRKENTRNNEPGYGRRQGNRQQKFL